MIPVYQPNLSGNEEKYVVDCIRSTWVSSKGKYIAEFEKQFANATAVKYAASVSNGTVALHLALLALDIRVGDEVIVPTLTYIASVNAITYTGATPVFVDSMQKHWQMDPEDIRNKLTSRTKAIMVVHLYGHPCDMTEIMAICKEYNLFLVEDCAEAFGARYKGQYVGSFGDIATYSFFGNKTITTGEGGMVVTNDEVLYDRILRLKGQGLAKNREYWHDIIGYNYRMTNICAAIGLAQLERANELLLRKRKIAMLYKELLNGTPIIFHDEIDDVVHSYWMVTILVKDVKLRDSIRGDLILDGIETRPIFYPIHTMPMYSIQYQEYPVAVNIAGRGISLPSWPDLTEQQIRFICFQIKKILLRGQK